MASSVPAQPGVTIGGLTIPAAPTDAQITGGSGRVDAVYILATPEEIAFIKPMIAMRNGSQSGATLYASSRSAQGTAGGFPSGDGRLTVQRNSDAGRR